MPRLGKHQLCTGMTGRAIPEWIGRTPDAPVPPRVRLRVFKAKGERCHRCRRKINAAGGEGWTCEHLIALCNGGENRESNLDVTCDWCKPDKDAEDVAEKSEVYHKAAKNVGIKLRKSRGFRGWRKMNGDLVWRDDRP